MPFKIPDSWLWCELDEILQYEQPTAYIVNSEEYSDLHSTPVLTAGKSFIIGHTDEKSGIYRNTPVIIFDDFTTDSKFVNFPFKVKSSAMKILTTNPNCADLKYLFYIMQAINFSASTHKRHWISEYSKFMIPLPPMHEQIRITNRIESTNILIDNMMEGL